MVHSVKSLLQAANYKTFNCQRNVYIASFVFFFREIRNYSMAGWITCKILHMENCCHVREDEGWKVGAVCIVRQGFMLRPQNHKRKIDQTSWIETKIIVVFRFVGCSPPGWFVEKDRDTSHTFFCSTSFSGDFDTKMFCAWKKLFTVRCCHRSDQLGVRNFASVDEHQWMSKYSWPSKEP